MNKIYALILVTITCLLTPAIKSQTLTNQQKIVVDKLFKKKGEVYFKFTINQKSEINTLTKIISIDNVENKTVYAFANKQGFTAFLPLNYTYAILPNPNTLRKVKMGKQHKSTSQIQATYNTYPTYPAYESMMNQFVVNYPTLCKLVNIGTLPSGKKLLMLKISDNINVRENEPQFLYTSSMHGDEIAGYVGMLHYIDYLLSNYGSDARITSLVNNMEIWINPLANPDGTFAGGDLTVNGATRYNANNIDLNRNYPDPAAGPHPDGNPYQPETNYFMAFADTMHFVMAANMHGGSELINYPWDTWPQLHADDDWYIRESNKYADTVHANCTPGYFTSQNNGVTNGYVWYTISGGRQDYMNYYKHCRELTLELSMIKIDPETDLLNNWNYNYKSWLNYMEEALHGIRGVVKDACSNQPIVAQVFISGHDFDSSHVYSALPLGDYYRPIINGTYNITFSAPGYQSKTINNVVVVDGSATLVNVDLQVATPVVNFTSNSINSCGGNISFTDLSGSSTSWLWSFGDGTTSTQQNPTHLYTNNGNYDVKLKISNCVGTDSLLKLNYLTVTINTPPSVQSATAIGCGSASVTLTATAANTIKWYDAPTGGNLVNTGASYTTPILSASTTYYVENSGLLGTTQHVGAANKNIGAGGAYSGPSYHYLTFSASNAFNLISVLVDASSAGNRIIQLRNSAGVVLQSATVNLPLGQSRALLNFNIPIGTDFQLGVSGNNNLFRNNTGGNYPYTLNGIVSITGNSAGNNAYYYYFYDWEITQTCNSLRVPVTATINPTTPVSSSIVSSANNSCSGTPISYTASVINGGTSPMYQWQVNGTNAGTANATFTSSTLSNNDVVTCMVTSSNICATGNPTISNSITATINPLPTTPVISLVGSSISSNVTTGNQWYNTSTGIIAGATTTNYTPTQNGSYYVIVSDINNCYSDTSNVILFLTSGIAENTSASFSVYPNPNNGVFTIDLSSLSNRETVIEMFNVVGELVYSQRTTNKINTVNSTVFEKGIYFLKVSSIMGNSVQKMMIIGK